MCFSPYLGIGCGGRVPRDWYTSCLCSFSSLCSSKIEVSNFIFLILWSPIMTRLARIYIVFTLFWVYVAWGRFSARWACGTQKNPPPPPLARSHVVIRLRHCLPHGVREAWGKTHLFLIHLILEYAKCGSTATAYLHGLSHAFGQWHLRIQLR